MYPFLINSLAFLQITEGSLLDIAEDMSILELVNRAIAYAILAAGLLSVIFIFIITIKTTIEKIGIYCEHLVEARIP
jgi:hypothetical protein